MGPKILRFTSVIERSSLYTGAILSGIRVEGSQRVGNGVFLAPGLIELRIKVVAQA